MAYRITSGGFGLPAIDTVDTSQQAPLGLEVQAIDDTYGAATFKYVKGVADGATGMWVTYNSDDYSTALLARDGIGPVGIMMSALVASTFGWIQTSGKNSSALAADAVADNGNLYSTTTAGKVDDAVSTGNRVQRAKAASAVTAAGAIEVELERPFVDDALGAGAT